MLYNQLVNVVLSEGKVDSALKFGAVGLGSLLALSPLAKQAYQNYQADRNLKNIAFIEPENSPIEKQGVPIELVLQAAEKLIRHHEGYEETVYPDSRNILTVGVGFNLQNPDAKSRIQKLGLNYELVRKGKQSLNANQIETLFKEDIQRAVKDAKTYLPNFDQIDPKAKIILIDMAFNLGLPKLIKFKDLRKALLNQNYKNAAEAMIDSNWYHQVGNRSKYLVHLMQTI